MQKEFNIDKVSWHTKTKGNPENREKIVLRFFSVVKFLQEHSLTTSILASNMEDITDDFSIKSSDLTDKGMMLMRKVYDKWLRRIDRGADPRDVTILEKALSDLVADS